MQVIKSKVIIVDDINQNDILKKIEAAGRTCYKSEAKITDTSAENFIKQIIRNGHDSVLEHEKLTVRIICDRGCCYDEQTEVLTQNGWKFFKDIQKNDKIACLDNNNSLIYHHPEQIIIQDYSGKLLEYKTTTIDLLVTPNHNMWVYDYHKRSKESKIWKFLQAHELRNKRYLLQKGGCYWESPINKIIIPKHRTKFIQFPEIKLNYEQTNALFELLGLWITDGSYNSKKNILITQIKQKGRDRIEKLCQILGFNYRYHNNSYYIGNGQLFDFVKNLFGFGAKSFTAFIPNYIKNSSRIQIQHFLNGVILGDGNIHKKNKHIVVYTSSNQFANDLQELFLKVGKSANIRTIPPRWRKGIKNSKEFTSKISFIVSVHQNPITLLNKQSAKSFGKEINYNGKVYCVTVPYHRLYVRRNGVPIWCGNSHELVRHRIGSFSQESTRYCDYNKGEMEFIDIKPHFRSPESVKIWEDLLQEIEHKYKLLRSLGETPQIARSILPNSLKTEIVITFNIRQWRHFFKLRTSKAAHPQMREVAIETLNLMKIKFPVLFEDIQVEK